MNSKELVATALGIHGPWQVTQIRHDLGQAQIDIWVGREAARSGWLFGQRGSVGAGLEQCWQHVNLGRLRCMVHGVSPLNGETPAWLGEEEQPFTRQLAQRIAALMRDGLSFGAICDLLDLPVADLWKFKHRLDNGKAALGAAATPGAPVSATLPAEDDAVWVALLDGSLTIDIHSLGLKLLLTKLRAQWLVIADPAVRGLKVQEVRHYFTRHEKSLPRELAQLRIHAIPYGDAP